MYTLSNTSLNSALVSGSNCGNKKKNTLLEGDFCLHKHVFTYSSCVCSCWVLHITSMSRRAYMQNISYTCSLRLSVSLMPCLTLFSFALCLSLSVSFTQTHTHACTLASSSRLLEQVEDWMSWPFFLMYSSQNNCLCTKVIFLLFGFSVS